MSIEDEYEDPRDKARVKDEPRNVALRGIQYEWNAEGEINKKGKTAMDCTVQPKEARHLMRDLIREVGMLQRQVHKLRKEVDELKKG